MTCRNPAWGAGTILVGLLSFMGETALTTGSVSSSKAEKRRLAAASLDYNMRRCQPVASLLTALLGMRAGDAAALGSHIIARGPDECGKALPTCHV